MQTHHQISANAGDEWVTEFERPYARYLLGVAVVAFASVALALGLQHFADMQPCAWCTFQRLLYLVVGVLALAAWLSSGRASAARAISGVGAVAGLGGLAAALYQQFVAAQTADCSLGFADRVVMGMGLDRAMPWMFETRALCDEANLPLFGVPFALWSAMLFAGLTVVLAIVAFSRGPLK